MQTLTSPVIFVIDDDASLRDDLVDYLLGEGYRAFGFASYEQFLPAAQLIQPALVLLDLGLPGLDGMDVCPLLRQRWPQVGVVMLTSRSSVAQQEAGLQAGADAYLSKTASLSLVEATVASVLRRLTPIAAAEDPVHTQEPNQTGWTVDESQMLIFSPDHIDTVLTVNEFKLVQFLINAQGSSVPREVLLELTGKADTPPNRRNLDAVISRIRAKVRTKTNLDLPLRASYANGYAFIPERASDASRAQHHPT